jgi:D-glycero-alpha-D-manno-heptose-7-phosphate kinase
MLAENACKIEISILKNPIGKQDQYNAAFGGFRSYSFLKNNKVIIKKFNGSIAKKIFSRALFLWVGNFKDSKKILEKQREVFKTKQKYYSELLSVADSFKKVCKNNFLNINTFGRLLNQNWNIKKKLSKHISNNKIDKLYEFAKKNGAIGGKLLGAGSGGFLFLVFNKFNTKKLLKIFQNKKIYFFDFYPKGAEEIYKKFYK